MSWLWLAAPVAGFVALMMVHDRTLRALRRTRRAVRYYEAGLARIEDRWIGTGHGGREHAPTEHPYAVDLDLFGPGSLFELLDTARTRSGETTLAGWLLAPADPGTIRDRQEAVTELRPGLDLREDLALLGEDVRGRVDPGAMIEWAEHPPVLANGFERVLAPVLAVANVAALLGWWLGPTGPLPAIAALACSAVFGLRLRGRVLQVFHAVQDPEADLELLAGVLDRLERERFRAPALVRMRGKLDRDGVRPSAAIAQLRRLVDAFNARRNQLFLPVSWLVLWSTQFAFAIEAWRARYGGAVRAWLDGVGEIEALGAIAGYAYEHPDDPFPEIVDDGPALEARDVGHPLIPADRCVRNDVHLGGERRMLVVSGSNMSGKSTLLRTIGVNVVLAQAGAPVRAASLSLSPLAVGATLRVQDSLQDGASRFYAEIIRLRGIMDLTSEPVPVLFLLDEILHGTNSHDRAIGAEGVLRGLLERGAVGLVTTHDLALARLADTLRPQVENVHFEDRVEAERMVFDYRMRPGTVRQSNALALMRSVGLDV